jgi:energy-coupling factor transporter ATP-binding protein EcfA2
MYDPFFLNPGSTSNVPYIYVVEGEMDALSTMSQFVPSGTALFPLMSVGGSGGSNHIQPILKTVGIDKAFMVGDAPSANGDVVVKEWLKKVPDVHARIFTGWDKLVPATDIDEAINDPNIGFTKVTDVLWKNSDAHFTMPWKWAYDQAVPVLDGIPDHDKRTLIEKAAEHGKFLQHPIERSSYIEAVTDDYAQIPIKLLKRELTKMEDNELGFINQCADALRDMFFVIGTRIKTNGRYLILQNKKEQTFHEMRINSGDGLTQELAPLVGSPFQFIDQDVGFPAFLRHPNEVEEGMVMPLLDKQITFYLKESVSVLCQGAPDFQAASRRKQGYHYVERDGKEDLEYIVCGKDVFRILRKEGEPPEYVKLEGPADNNLIFDINFDGMPPATWFPGGLSVDLLKEGANTDLSRLFDEIEQYYDCAFKFKNQKVTSTLLAAMLMSYPVMDALERPVLMFITGHSHSGKSTLLSTMAGSRKSSKLSKCRLYYSSYQVHDYTPASVARTADLSSQLAVLDEFEVGDEQNGWRAKGVLSMIRSMINGEVQRVRAKPDGVGVNTFTLRMPMIFAAITGAEKPEDINRMVIVEMQRTEAHDAPAEILERTFGIDKIQEMARGLNTAMYAHAMELRKHYYEVSNDYHKLIEALPVKVDFRYLSSLFGPLAVMKMLGKDWKQFLVNFVTRNETMINVANTASVAETYLNRILNTPVVYNHDTHQSEPVGMLLANPDRWDEINRAVCGVFFDKKQSLLLVLMDQAVTKFFQGERLSSMRLKEALQRHKLAIRSQDVLQHGIVQQAVAYLGAGVTSSGVVVFRAKDLIDSTRNAVEMHAAMEDDKDQGKEDADETAEDSDDTSNIKW